MGQKVNPTGMRLKIIPGKSKASWIPGVDEKYADILRSDITIREDVRKSLPEASSISEIYIERTGKNIKIIIKTAKPGIIIGKKGEDIEKLRARFVRELGCNVQISIDEIRKPEIDAPLVASAVAKQLEQRVMFRRAMKRAVQNALRQGAKGIKISVSGRLGGAEIARTEWYREGRVPLHTFRADIDYSTAEAKTTYGIIGVKVWIFKGEVIGEQVEQVEETAKTKPTPNKAKGRGAAAQ